MFSLVFITCMASAPYCAVDVVGHYPNEKVCKIILRKTSLTYLVALQDFPDQRMYAVCKKTDVS